MSRREKREEEKRLSRRGRRSEPSRESRENSERTERSEMPKGNSSMKMLGSFLYWIIFAFTVVLLFVVLIQRFSNNTFSLGGFKIFNVITGSMEPEYMIGDVLLSKTKPISEIQVGDDVVYKGEKGDYEDKIVTHRVIKTKSKAGEYTFITQGIANDEPDPEISGNQILGVVTYKIESLSLISKAINNLYSFYFIVFLPLVFLLFIEVRKMVLKPNRTEELKSARRQRAREEQEKQEENK